MWDRVVSLDIEQSHVGQRSLMWDGTISCGTDQSYVEQSNLI